MQFLLFQTILKKSIQLQISKLLDSFIQKSIIKQFTPKKFKIFKCYNFEIKLKFGFNNSIVYYLYCIIFLKAENCQQNSYSPMLLTQPNKFDNKSLNSKKYETFKNSQNNPFKIKYSEQQVLSPTDYEQNQQQTFKQKIQKNIIFLNVKDEVESLQGQQSQSNDNFSEDMDIDQQNDVVNQLSFIQELQKNDQQDQMFADLNTKERLLYANSKKHQANQFFKQNNLEDAIQSYKFGLSLLKPESFIGASQRDCLAMAQLTSNILYNMGTCYLILMSYRYAIKFYDQAILIKPTYTKALHNRALCHVQQNNILSAYNDIKLAHSLDKQNNSIKGDYQRIYNEYIKKYRHQKNQLYTFQIEDKKLLSKSMIINENTAPAQAKKNSQMSSSMIIAPEMPTQNKDIAQTIKQKSPQRPLLQKKNSLTQKRERVKSFYSKKFFQSPLCFNKSKKNNKSLSILNSPKSPNQTRSPLNKFPKFSQNILEGLQFQNSAGQLFEREKRIKNIQNQIEQKKNLLKTRQKINTDMNLIKMIDSQKQIEDKKKQTLELNNKQKKQDQLWGYVPLVAAASFGIYHSLKAFLGK